MSTKSTKFTFWNIWTSYATYYFGKVNLSIVVPALLATHQNLSLMNVGLVSSGFFFAYAVGQFLHGQISERFNPFKYIAAGLIGSAILNAVLGFWGGFFLVLLIGEMCDGAMQSMGWSSCVRANALIQKPENRERSSTILGTSYQVGNSVAWLVSSFAVGVWGWRAGFLVASTLLAIRGILLLYTAPSIVVKPHKKVSTQIKKTLSFSIVASGLGLCLLNMVRYGIITWIPLYFFNQGMLEVSEMGQVGLKVCLFPIAGVLGTLAYNKIKADRDVISIVCMGLLAVSFFAIPFVTGFSILALLLLGSALLYGTHVFLVATVPTRVVGDRVTGAATGFIDGMGYVGTVLVGILVPLLLGSEGTAWNRVFVFWGVLSVVIAVLVAIMYTHKKNK